MTTGQGVQQRAAVRDVGVQVAGRALNLALGVVVTALVARTLGNAAYGQWATIFAVLGIAGELASFGFTGVAVRQAATDPGRENAWIGALVTLQALTCALVVPICAAVLLLVAKSAEMRVASLVLLGTVLLIVPNSMRAIFQIRMRNGIPVGVTTLNSLLWAGAVVVLAVGGSGLVGFAIAFVAVAVLTSTVEAVLAIRLMGVRLRGTRGLWGELLRIGVPVGAGTLMIVAYARIDQIMVFELAGAREAGLYGAAYRILDQAHFIPFSIIVTLAPITAASAAVDPERLWRIVVLAARVLLMVSLGGLAVALAVAEPFMALVFGEGYREAGAALPVLAGAFVFMCLGYLSGNLVLVFRLQKQFLALAAAGLALNVGLNLLLIPRYGYVAAAWTTLLTEVAVVIPALTLGLLRLPRRIPFAPFARILAAACGLTLGIQALRAVGVPVLVTLVLAGPLYLGLLLTTRGLDMAQLRSATDALLKKGRG